MSVSSLKTILFGHLPILDDLGITTTSKTDPAQQPGTSKELDQVVPLLLFQLIPLILKDVVIPPTLMRRFNSLDGEQHTTPGRYGPQFQSPGIFMSPLKVGDIQFLI